MNTQQIYTDMTDSAMPQTQPAEVGSDLYNAQRSLIESVIGYADSATPIPTLTKMLEMWISSPTFNPTDIDNKAELRRMLRLIDFLTDLREKRDVLLTLDPTLM